MRKISQSIHLAKHAKQNVDLYSPYSVDVVADSTGCTTIQLTWQGALVLMWVGADVDESDVTCGTTARVTHGMG
jgi:hypothetical protein